MSTVPTRTLGSGLEVTALGLGCMGISQSFGATPDRATAIAFLRDAVDHGVVPCAMSPNTVAAPVEHRRPTARSCIGDRSWASSRTT